MLAFSKLGTTEDRIYQRQKLKAAPKSGHLNWRSWSRGASGPAMKFYGLWRKKLEEWEFYLLIID
jgi:hypothetical protein